MGIFEELGRNYEEFKRDVSQRADETAAFQCGECGELVHADVDTCPECGADAVEER